jgi:hypothetical protein
MSKSFKEKVKENKGRILTGVIFGVAIIGGGYVIISKNKQIDILKDENKTLTKNILESVKECCDLREQVDQNTEDIELLRDVMSKDVIGTLKQALINKLRYHEGRLNNGMKKGSNMTEADIKMHEETIDFVNNQLLKLAKAEERLDNK